VAHGKIQIRDLENSKRYNGGNKKFLSLNTTALIHLSNLHRTVISSLKINSVMLFHIYNFYC